MKRTLENNKFSMTYAYVNVKIKKAAKKLNAFGLACDLCKKNQCSAKR